MKYVKEAIPRNHNTIKNNVLETLLSTFLKCEGIIACVFIRFIAYRNCDYFITVQYVVIITTSKTLSLHTQMKEMSFKASVIRYYVTTLPYTCSPEAVWMKIWFMTLVIKLVPKPHLIGKSFMNIQDFTR